MDSLEQSGGRIASAIVKLGGQGQAPSPFRLGQVLEAGQGRLRVSCGGAPAGAGGPVSGGRSGLSVDGGHGRP